MQSLEKNSAQQNAHATKPQDNGSSMLINLSRQAMQKLLADDLNNLLADGSNQLTELTRQNDKLEQCSNAYRTMQVLYTIHIAGMPLANQPSALSSYYSQAVLPFNNAVARVLTSKVFEMKMATPLIESIRGTFLLFEQIHDYIEDGLNTKPLKTEKNNKKNKKKLTPRQLVLISKQELISLQVAFLRHQAQTQVMILLHLMDKDFSSHQQQIQQSFTAVLESMLAAAKQLRRQVEWFNNNNQKALDRTGMVYFHEFFTREFRPLQLILVDNTEFDADVRQQWLQSLQQLHQAIIDIPTPNKQHQTCVEFIQMGRTAEIAVRSLIPNNESYCGWIPITHQNGVMVVDDANVNDISRKKCQSLINQLGLLSQQTQASIGLVDDTLLWLTQTSVSAKLADKIRLRKKAIDSFDANLLRSCIRSRNPLVYYQPAQVPYSLNNYIEIHRNITAANSYFAEAVMSLRRQRQQQAYKQLTRAEQQMLQEPVDCNYLILFRSWIVYAILVSSDDEILLTAALEQIKTIQVESEKLRHRPGALCNTHINDEIGQKLTQCIHRLDAKRMQASLPAALRAKMAVAMKQLREVVGIAGVYSTVTDADDKKVDVMILSPEQVNYADTDSIAVDVAGFTAQVNDFAEKMQSAAATGPVPVSLLRSEVRQVIAKAIHLNWGIIKYFVNREDLTAEEIDLFERWIPQCHALTRRTQEIVLALDAVDQECRLTQKELLPILGKFQLEQWYALMVVNGFKCDLVMKSMGMTLPLLLQRANIFVHYTKHLLTIAEFCHQAVEPIDAKTINSYALALKNNFIDSYSNLVNRLQIEESCLAILISATAAIQTMHEKLLALPQAFADFDQAQETFADLDTQLNKLCQQFYPKSFRVGRTNFVNELKRFDGHFAAVKAALSARESQPQALTEALEQLLTHLGEHDFAAVDKDGDLAELLPLLTLEDRVVHRQQLLRIQTQLNLCRGIVCPPGAEPSQLEATRRQQLVRLNRYLMKLFVLQYQNETYLASILKETPANKARDLNHEQIVVKLLELMQQQLQVCSQLLADPEVEAEVVLSVCKNMEIYIKYAVIQGHLPDRPAMSTAISANFDAIHRLFGQLRRQRNDAAFNGYCQRLSDSLAVLDNQGPHFLPPVSVRLDADSLHCQLPAKPAKASDEVDAFTQTVTRYHTVINGLMDLSTEITASITDDHQSRDNARYQQLLLQCRALRAQCPDITEAQQNNVPVVFDTTGIAQYSMYPKNAHAYAEAWYFYCVALLESNYGDADVAVFQPVIEIINNDIHYSLFKVNLICHMVSALGQVQQNEAGASLAMQLLGRINYFVNIDQISAQPELPQALRKRIEAACHDAEQLIDAHQNEAKTPLTDIKLLKLLLGPLRQRIELEQASKPFAQASRDLIVPAAIVSTTNLVTPTTSDKESEITAIADFEVLYVDSVHDEMTKSSGEKQVGEVDSVYVAHQRLEFANRHMQAIVDMISDWSQHNDSDGVRAFASKIGALHKHVMALMVDSQSLSQKQPVKLKQWRALAKKAENFSSLYYSLTSKAEFTALNDALGCDADLAIISFVGGLIKLEFEFQQWLSICQSSHEAEIQEAGNRLGIIMQTLANEYAQLERPVATQVSDEIERITPLFEHLHQFKSKLLTQMLDQLCQPALNTAWKISREAVLTSLAMILENLDAISRIKAINEVAAVVEQVQQSRTLVNRVHDFIEHFGGPVLIQTEVSHFFIDLASRKKLAEHTPRLLDVIMACQKECLALNELHKSFTKKQTMTTKRAEQLRKQVQACKQKTQAAVSKATLEWSNTESMPIIRFQWSGIDVALSPVALLEKMQDAVLAQADAMIKEIETLHSKETEAQKQRAALAEQRRLAKQEKQQQKAAARKAAQEEAARKAAEEEAARKAAEEEAARKAAEQQAELQLAEQVALQQQQNKSPASDSSADPEQPSSQSNASSSNSMHSLTSSPEIEGQDDPADEFQPVRKPKTKKSKCQQRLQRHERKRIMAPMPARENNLIAARVSLPATTQATNSVMTKMTHERPKATAVQTTTTPPSSGCSYADILCGIPKSAAAKQAAPAATMSGRKAAKVSNRPRSVSAPPVADCDFYWPGERSVFVAVVRQSQQPFYRQDLHRARAVYDEKMQRPQTNSRVYIADDGNFSHELNPNSPAYIPINMRAEYNNAPTWADVARTPPRF